MSHLLNELGPSARAPRPASTFYKSLQDHTTKYRLRKLSSGSFQKEKIPRSERPSKTKVPPEQRMQGVRRGTAEVQIRRVKWWAVKRISVLTHKAHKAIRRSQELRQRILHARDETVDFLIPLFEELGTEPSAVLDAQTLAKKLDKKITKIENKIATVERRIRKLQRDIERVERKRDAKIGSYQLHIKNLTRKTEIGVEGSVGKEDAGEKAAANTRKAAELWLHTRLNRHTRSCASFDRPLHRSKSRRGNSVEGIRVRWSGDLSVSNTVTIRPTESGTTGEISRSSSLDSRSSSIVNVDAVVAIPADAIGEGLELGLKVVKREAPQRQFNPQEAVVKKKSNEGDAKVGGQNFQLEEKESRTKSRTERSGSGGGSSEEESKEESTTEPESESSEEASRGTPEVSNEVGKGSEQGQEEIGQGPEERSEEGLKEVIEETQRAGAGASSTAEESPNPILEEESRDSGQGFEGGPEARLEAGLEHPEEEEGPKAESENLEERPQEL
ncbi:hypothetical protein EYR41_002713 [Orbilia oligospora]|uniref:Uncharacterized protein n=1 Tax=Orbilia oligospora TaxID=2813651 RepID=A0A7C8KKG0_ORBOL|nr:hypothetical protein TWF751_008868 [Orbilia oligospora]TGJ70682.1 hypothetical protein EYR41_002713 [Orbilia oligospora]